MSNLPNLNDPVAVVARLLKGWGWTKPETSEFGAKMLVGALRGAGWELVKRAPATPGET